MKKKLLLTGIILFSIISMMNAALTINIGVSELRTGGYYVFPNLTVSGTEKGYVIRLMFTRAVTNDDEITLPALPSGWSQSSASTQWVRVVNVNMGATAGELETFLRQVRVKFAASKKGQEIMVLISETSADAGRNIFYSAATTHYYEYVASYGIQWIAAYNTALKTRFMGLKGYLATITSSEEQGLLRTIASGNQGWIGGTRGKINFNADSTIASFSSTASTDNFWYWASGPEFNKNGRDPVKAAFYHKITHNATGAGISSIDPANLPYPYNSWASSEPNNFNTEYVAHLTTTGQWNDYYNHNTSCNGYMVEYEEGKLQGTSGTSTVGFHATKSAMPASGTSSSPTTLYFGDTIAYTITATNASDDDTNVKITDKIPAGWTVSDISDNGTRNGNSITWNLTIGINGGQKSVTFKATPSRALVTGPALLPYTNSALVTCNNKGKPITIKTNSTYHQVKRAQVTFVLNGTGAADPSAATPAQTIDYGFSPVAGVTATPHPHYRFKDWSHPAYTDFKGTSRPSERNTDYTAFKVYGDVTVTANFEIITYTLSYDGNGNTSGSAPPQETHNTHTYPPLSANSGKLTKPEAAFIGWSATKTNIITQTSNEPADLKQPGETFQITSDTTFYAVWAIDKGGPGGVSDSVPDYRQFKTTYNKSLAGVNGAEPVDGNLYDSGNNVTVKGNEGTPQMTLTDAIFIGWSFTNPATVVTSSAGIPGDLIQPAKTFPISSDVTLYAVWAVDKTGPGGTPDGLPDFGQSSVTYDRTLAASGTAPVDNNLYNSGTSVTVKGNEGVPQMTLPNATFIGWSFEVRNAVIDSYSSLPPLLTSGNTFLITADTVLYAVWAEDRSGPNGVPDDVPDYGQFNVVYDGNTHTGGAVPTDRNLYNNGNTVTVSGNTGILSKTDACFIGWSFTQNAVITTSTGIPGDLKQAGDNFIITSPATIYAVWAADRNGPDGTPDNVPDYLQRKVTYNQNTAKPSAGGSLPPPTMHTMNTSAVIKGNTGGLFGNPSEKPAFAGWTQTDNWGLVSTAAQMPPDMLYAGDLLPVTTADIDLYVVWAKDGNGDGIPDYNEPQLIITPEHEWPREQIADPSNPEIYPARPEWKPEYEVAGKDTWSIGCDMCFTMTADPDPYRDRVFRISYLGALKKEYVIDRTTGKPLEDAYVLPKGTSTYVLYFTLTDIPAGEAGLEGALKVAFDIGGSDLSAWVRLYNQPAYDRVVINPYVNANNKIDLGITGGSPNLMRSINGHAWRNAREPLNNIEQLSVNEGVSIWLREPNGCWEKQFFFASYESPEIAHSIDIPSSTDVITNPGAGRYYVNGYRDFTFTASFPGGTPLKIMAEGFYSGTYTELIGQDLNDGTYQYVISKVVEPWTVSFDSVPASWITGEQHVGVLSVWSYKNTLHIRSDRNTKASIYILDGSLYKYLDIKEGDNKEILNPDIYLIVIGNERYKVIIH